MIALASCHTPGTANLVRPDRPGSWLVRQAQLMGGSFRFRSDSQALLDLVDAAYGGLGQHRFPLEGPELAVELRLLPRQASVAREPPSVRTRLEGGLLWGIMDDRNYVLVSPKQRRAQVVASADMLDSPYHLRYELIEFAVFLLAARCQDLVPLHAACVGHEGRGILLLGSSGAGKSTLVLASLLQGMEILSEDAVFVRPDGMLATGVANFLHVRSDALPSIDDVAAQHWVAGSPVIRRRSGVEKFEADLRRAPGSVRLAAAPLQLVGTAILSPQGSGRAKALLMPVTSDQAASSLAADQAYARTRPGWHHFQRSTMRTGIHTLLRGRHPEDSVHALRQLLD